MADRSGRDAGVFVRQYPSVARWITDQEWIEIGLIDGGDTFVRALDEGGLRWEGKADYHSLDAALDDLERGLAVWVREEFGE